MAETLYLQSLVVIVACAGLVFLFAKLDLPEVVATLSPSPLSVRTAWEVRPAVKECVSLAT